MRPQRVRYATRGFTLIELMVSVVLMFMTLTALLGAFLSLSRLSTMNQNRTQALHDAELIMEKLREQSYTIVLPDGTPPVGAVDWTTWLSTQKPASLILPGETAVVTPGPVGGGLVDLNNLTVTISWAEQGRTQSVSLSELFTMRVPL